MRWNPRRRRDTVVVHVHPGKPVESQTVEQPVSAALVAQPEPEKAKSPWNSLEVAKIIVGASTPIVLALFTYFTTKQSHDQEAARAKQMQEQEEQRVAREDLKSRKEAIQALAYDIREQSTKIFDAAEVYDESMEKNAKNGALRIRYSEVFWKTYNAFQRSTDDAYRKIDADWSRIELIIRDSTKFNDIIAMYSHGKSAKFSYDFGLCSIEQGRLCSGDRMGASSCVDFIVSRLIYFDREIDGAVLNEASDECAWPINADDEEDEEYLNQSQILFKSLH